MNEHDLRRLIRQEIALQQIISSGTAGANTTTAEDIQALFPGLDTLIARPIMHPYGFISRAKKNTISVTAQQGNHPGNKLTLGHRDANPPAVAEGESAIYSMNGYLVKVFLDKVQVGKGTTFQTLVLGETLTTLLTDLLDALATQADALKQMATDLSTHTHPTAAPGSPSPPTNAASFVQAATAMTTAKTTYDNKKSSPVGDNKLLAKDGGGF